MSTPDKPQVYILAHKTDCEYFCRDCGQLRFCGSKNRPVKCGNCQSSNIVVDELNSKKLDKLKVDFVSGTTKGIGR